MPLRLRLCVAAPISVFVLLATVVPVAASAAPEAAEHRLIVSYEPAVSDAVRALALRSAGARRVSSIPALGVEVVAASGDRGAAMSALRRSGAVADVEVDGFAHVAVTAPNDPYWGRQWSPVQTRATEAWDVTTGDPSVVIAVLDTGVSASHVELAGKLVAGRNVLTDSSNAADDHGHGTQSAGVIAALSNNATGVASYCWSCRVMPVKVLGANGTGYMSDVAEGIVWAADHGARVISMSLSGPTGGSTLASAVRYAQDRGVVLAAAAGNDGATIPTYPAAYAEVIGVGATDSTDTLYTWTNRGSWVDVTAPGVNMSTNYTGAYASYAGTSSATPVVAGIAGLAFSANPAASGAAVRAAIEGAAVPVVGSAHGRVDAMETLLTLGGAAPSDPPPVEEPPIEEPVEDPVEEPASQPVTTVFNGSLSGRNLLRSHSVSVGQGGQNATLSFSKVSQLTVAVFDSSGAKVATATGASPLSVNISGAAGTYRYEVSGAKSTYTLSVTAPAA